MVLLLCFWCKGTSWGVAIHCTSCFLHLLPYLLRYSSTLLAKARNFSRQVKQSKPCQLGTRTRHYQDSQLQFLITQNAVFHHPLLQLKRMGVLKRKMEAAGSLHLRRAQHKTLLPVSKTPKILLPFLILLHTTRINNWGQLPVAENSSSSFELIFHVLSPPKSFNNEELLGENKFDLVGFSF